MTVPYPTFPYKQTKSTSPLLTQETVSRRTNNLLHLVHQHNVNSRWQYCIGIMKLLHPLLPCMGSMNKFLYIFTIYIYIYLEPVCPLFLALTPPKQGLFQSKQGSFGFQVYIHMALNHVEGWYPQPTLPVADLSKGIKSPPLPR